MKKVWRSSRVFTGVHVIGWTVVIIFIVWLFSGCSSGGGGDDVYVVPPEPIPECVNEFVPCLDEEWSRIWLFDDPRGHEPIEVYSWGFEFYVIAYVHGPEGYYLYDIRGWPDTCTKGSFFAIRRVFNGNWYDAEGWAEICNDALSFEVWKPGTKDSWVEIIETPFK